jgi:hypothetical protein
MILACDVEPWGGIETREIPMSEERTSPNDATVFVVDDDQAMRESLEFLLTSAGLAVESFASAQEFPATRRRAPAVS